MNRDNRLNEAILLLVFWFRFCISSSLVTTIARVNKPHSSAILLLRMEMLETALRTFLSETSSLHGWNVLFPPVSLAPAPPSEEHQCNKSESLGYKLGKLIKKKCSEHNFQNIGDYVGCFHTFGKYTSSKI